MTRESRALVYPTADEMTGGDHYRLHSYDVQPNGCWLWNRTVGRGGYPVISIGSHYYQVHRLIHGQHFRPAPATWDVDHKCRNPLCVNPDHLEAVPHRENVRRAYDPTFNPARGAA